MKDFQEFKNYIAENSQTIHDDIVHTVADQIKSMDFDNDPGMKHETYRRAWVEIGFMKLIEYYHEWLHSEG